jgi:competence protein ComEC
MKTTSFAICALLVIGLNGGAALAGRDDGRLDIYWVDVEGGAATIVVGPTGESALIDTGMPSQFQGSGGHNDPERIFKVLSEAAGLKKIDCLIVTHFHVDHFGGAAELATMIPIGRLYDFGIPDRNPDPNPSFDTAFLALVKPYRDMAVGERRIIKAGDVISLGKPQDGLSPKLRCIAAKQQMTQPTPGQPANPLAAELQTKDPDASDNANSVALVLEFGAFRFFAGADLTWNVEGRLVVPVNLVGVVDVFQVDHHGFDVSNNPVLVRSLAPTVTVMLNGTRKGCGPQTVALLKSLPSARANYQMHRCLSPGAANTSDDLIANGQADCKANYIKLSVAPDGRSYKVTIPALGHEREFKTRAD